MGFFRLPPWYIVRKLLLQKPWAYGISQTECSACSAEVRLTNENLGAGGPDSTAYGSTRHYCLRHGADVGARRLRADTSSKGTRGTLLRQPDRVLTCTVAGRLVISATAFGT
jgi:hypothetical protein